MQASTQAVISGLITAGGGDRCYSDTMRMILTTILALVLTAATAHAARRTASLGSYGESRSTFENEGRCNNDRCFDKHPGGIYVHRKTSRSRTSFDLP